MTLIAQFDLEQDPPVVVTLYDYGDDDVPKHYKPPEYVDVTEKDPRPQPGSTLHPVDGWVHPPPPEDVQGWAAEIVAANETFLLDKNPTALETEHQCQALTRQINGMLQRQYGL